MKKSTTLILLVVLMGTASAQNYIKRTAEEPVYDVEVIVFGQLLSQPTVDSIQQAVIFDQEAAATVDFLPADEDWPFIKTQTNLAQSNSDDSQLTANPQDDSWQVPLDEKPIDYDVLVWFLKTNQLAGPVVNLLDNNPKYKPLLRQAWRQPATPFNNPLYVKINTQTHDNEFSTNQSNIDDENMVIDLTDFNENLTPKIDIRDFQVDGQVALSQGRFTHLHIKFNYYRINQQNEPLIYASKQQRQIKLNQWQYFDHQQFGVLIKVTAVKAEELL